MQFLKKSKKKIIKTSLARTKIVHLLTENSAPGERILGKKEAAKDGVANA